MEKADGLNGTKRSPDTQVNGVILSPARAELLQAAIRKRFVTSPEKMRTFLAALEKEQRAADKADPEVAEVRRLMWKNDEIRRKGASPEKRASMSKADMLAKLAEMVDQIGSLAAKVRE